MIDKIETAAKARAARDFGIGTEHALDIEDALIQDYVPGQEPDPVKPAAQRQTNKPTEEARKSGETNKAFTKVEPQRPDAATTPSAKELRQRVAALKMEWRAVLSSVFTSQIKSGNVTLEALVNAGDEIGLDYCKAILVFVQKIEASRASTNKAS